MMNKDISYKRVLLKLSGEILCGKESFGIDKELLLRLTQTIKKIHEEGLELAIVIGGGNIFRGKALADLKMAQSASDQIGMLSTLMNGIALEQSLKSLKCPVKLFSAVPCPTIAESYQWGKANSALSNGEVVIFVGGTGNPYFTTDSAAALRASEMHADILLKATKVDGIYDSDPKLFPNAKKYDEITYDEAIEKNLKIMDSTAFALCKNTSLPIFVFNMKKLFELPVLDILSKKSFGTFVKEVKHEL